MQPKVSMVVACYNKVDYISEMLESVIAQKWDNIEIILVNDGSVDGTREVMSLYEEKLKARGYEIKIFDQENQGVAAAVKNGLKLVTGEFVCMPDCDDFLHEDYVFSMVNALNEFPDVNCVICDESRNRWDMGFAPDISSSELSHVSSCNLIESFLLGRLLTHVGVIMLRASLISKLHLIENFVTHVSNTQEPQIWLPIMSSEDSIVHLKRPLYSYILRDNSIVTSQTNMKLLWRYAETKCVLVQETLSKYIDSSSKLNFYSKLETIYKYAFMIRRINRNSHLKKYKPEYISLFLQSVEDSGLIPIKLSEKCIENSGYTILYHAISNYFIGYSPKYRGALDTIRRAEGRLIAYGGGFVAKSTLEDFARCNIIPNEVWDRSAQENTNLFGIPVVTPDFESLKNNDTVIIFMYGDRDVELRIRQSNSNVFYFHDVLDDLSSEFYPELVPRLDNA
ncbi:glycosyltransferase family 2 protein [Paenibacillus amylolyticus]|uniref:glycosyltransferase family 2 protein n=1 Tax=Paenibacillus amylolyticus TaxID=1451 RepID=UPI003EBC2621